MSDNPSALPSFVKSANFPFEGQLRVKRIDPPVAEEPAREGVDPSECVACGTPDDAYIWVSDRWRVRAMDRPGGLPMVLILESRSHLDLGDLPNLLAAELGVMTVRLERAIRSLDGVASVHINRWADGPAHLHLWFLARPAGRLQLRGTFLSMWDDILERVNENRWQEDLALVAAWLGEFGGRVLAEPPRIEWHAPSTFGEPFAQSMTEPVQDTPASHIATADSPEGVEAAAQAAETTPPHTATATTQTGLAPQAGPTAQGVATVPTTPTAHGVASVPGASAPAAAGVSAPNAPSTNPGQAATPDRGTPAGEPAGQRPAGAQAAATLGAPSGPAGVQPAAQGPAGHQPDSAQGSQAPSAAQNGASRSRNHDQSMDFLTEIAGGDDNFDFATDARASAV